MSHHEAIRVNIHTHIHVNVYTYIYVVVVVSVVVVAAAATVVIVIVVVGGGGVVVVVVFCSGNFIEVVVVACSVNVVGTNVQQICPCLLIILWNSSNLDDASKQVPGCSFEYSAMTEVLGWFSSNVEKVPFWVTSELRPSMFVNAVVSYGKVSNSVSSFTET